MRNRKTMLKGVLATWAFFLALVGEYWLLSHCEILGIIIGVTAFGVVITAYAMDF